MAGKKASREQAAPTYYKVDVPNRLERDPRLESLLVEYGRSIIGKDLPSDPTIAKVIASAVATTKILSSIQSIPHHLSVPDAPSCEEFLKNARTAYRKAHPPGKRGPKFSLGDALVWVARLEHKLNRQPNRKEIIAHVTDKDQCGSYPVSIRTAKNLATLYCQLTLYSSCGRTGPNLSKEDVRWLRKNLTPNQRSSDNWWTQLLVQWQHAKLEASGLSQVIRDAFSLSNDGLMKERNNLEVLRLLHTFGKR